jgi:hypothetical protein
MSNAETLIIIVVALRAEQLTASSARQGEASLLYTQSPSAKVCRPSWIPYWR